MAKRKSNGKALVIVESPAKAKTINKHLGSGYVVKASMGHVRDLPRRDLGIDVTNDFKPTYEIVRGRARTVILVTVPALNSAGHVKTRHLHGPFLGPGRGAGARCWMVRR